MNNGSSIEAGGAFYINTGATAIVLYSNFTNNAAQSGGGISSNGPLTLTNSTFSGNYPSYGGGISNNMRTAVIRNSTLSGNSALSGGAGVYSVNGTMTLYDSIVANSTDGSDCLGSMTDGGNNLVEDNSCSFTGGSDPALRPLGNYGGPTETMPLSAGSPALNAGNNARCAAINQRGVLRPRGLICDIVAFEYRIPTVRSLNPCPRQKPPPLPNCLKLSRLYNLVRAFDSPSRDLTHTQPSHPAPSVLQPSRL